MTQVVHQLGDLTPDPYEAALEQALADIAAARTSANGLRAELSAVELRCRELGELVQTLAALLPTTRGSLFLKRLRDIDAFPTPVSVKGGPAFGNVINLLARHKQRDGSEITSVEVKEALVENGPRHEPKEIDNVLAYLAKSGQLRRVSRGRYFIRELHIGLNLSFDFDEGQHAQEDQDS
jgi:hypothetical protein